MNKQKTELDYFDFSLEPGLKKCDRISKFVGNISISIITHYTGNINIKQTYISILNQTFPHWEWLIVTTKNDDTIKQMQKGDKRVKIIEIEENEIKKAQYIAARQANSDIILLLFEDDLIDKTMLDCAYFTMKTNPEGVWAYSRMVNFGEKNELYNERLSIHEMLKRNMLLKCVFIRKEKFLESEEDAELSMQRYGRWYLWLYFLSKSYIPIKMDFYGYWHRENPNGRKNDEQKREVSKKYIEKTKLKIDSDVDTIEFDKVFRIDFKDMPQKREITKKYIFETNRKKKILFITPWFLVGGADIFTLNLIKGLRQNNFDISVITTQKCNYVLRQEVEKYVDEYFDLTTFLKEKDWASFIYHIIKTRKIDCVLITNSFYGYYALPWLKYHFKEIPFIDYIHAENLTLRNGGFPKDSNSVANYLDATFTCTKHLRDVMYKIMNRSVKNIKPVYIGTDTTFYDPNLKFDGEEELIEKYKDKKVILFIGRMVHYKRPLFAIKVLKELLKEEKNLRMIMVGDGIAFEDVKEQVKEQGLEEYVHFYGMQDDVRKFYKIANVTLVCSLREGLTLTTYESLAMGVPVVSSNIGGQKEIIEEDCGYLIRPYQLPEEQFDFNYSEEEIQEYKKAIQNILKNEQQTNYSEISRKKVIDRFSINKMITNMDKEISKLINTGSNVNKEYCKNIEFAERYLLINSMLESLNKSIEIKNKEIKENETKKD